MGLTTEQWHKKRTQEIIDYVISKGTRISKTEIYWNTYPIVVMDICVLGALVREGKETTLSFGDMEKDGTFKDRKSPEQLERKYLEEILIDMKRTDGLKVADRKTGGRKFTKK